MPPDSSRYKEEGMFEVGRFIFIEFSFDRATEEKHKVQQHLLDACLDWLSE